MGTIIFILCLILSCFAWDIIIKLSGLIFSKKKMLQLVDKFLKIFSYKSFLYVSFYAGLRLIIESDIKQELPDRFIVIANHQSLTDIIATVMCFPLHDMKFVAKRHLKYGVPGVSPVLRLGGHALISRRSGFSETKRQLTKLAKVYGKNFCPVIYPEGTRSRTGQLGKFHTAGLRFLLKYNKLPIIAVAIDGGYKIAKFFDLFLKLRGLKYRAKILKIYPYISDKHQIKALLETIYTDINNQLKFWRRS